MNTAALLPPVPKPPHDPLSWLLDARTGWQAAQLDGIEIAPSDQSLALTPIADSGRLTESGRGFGGLRLPSSMALSPDGDLFLLDNQSGALKRFDRCQCQFDVVPCTAGLGDTPRQVMSPGGIAIGRGNLYLCDTGHNRLLVFSLRGFVLRDTWSPPASAGLAQVWQPSDVTLDSRQRVLVGDPANGCVHVFNAGGHWIKALSGLGDIQAILTDCDDRLYVSVSGEDSVRILDPQTGRLLEQVSRPEQIEGRFAKPPLAVDPAGNVLLSGLCTSLDGQFSESTALFDQTGAKVLAAPPTASLRYFTVGTYLSEPLDSGLYQCQWDRLVLHADVPEGARIQVLTFSAETEQPIALIKTFRDDAWATRQTLHTGQGAESANGWDCLVRSVPGRFLWLKLLFQGNGTATPRVTSIQVDFPRISLRRYLPGVFGAEPLAADFTDRFLAVFDRTFRDLERQIDEQAALFDPLSAPSGNGQDGKDFLSWLGTWLGVATERHWPIERRRRLLKEAGKSFDQRGTLTGLQRYLELYLGLQPSERQCPSAPGCGPCTTAAAPAWRPPPFVLEHFKLRRWLFLGQGRLGAQARLWGEALLHRCQVGGPDALRQTRLGQFRLKGTQKPEPDPFNLYAHRFSAFIPACLSRSAERRKGLERLLAMEKPAHTAHQIVYVEPRFRIGIQSMIGFDAVIGRYPEGVTLDQTALGPASVLGPAASGGPSFQIGVAARVGTSTRLS